MEFQLVTFSKGIAFFGFIQLFKLNRVGVDLSFLFPFVFLHVLWGSYEFILSFSKETYLIV